MSVPGAGPPDPSRRGRVLATAAALFAGALAIRVLGLDFGLPYFFSGDEVEKVEVALFLADTRFDHWDGQPSFLFNTLFAIYWVAEKLFPHLTNVDYLYLGRLWMAVLGSLTVVVAWRLGARFGHGGDRPGLWAGVLLAVLPLHTATSRYIKEDAPLALMTALAVLAAVAFQQVPSRRRLAWLGLAVGAAISTKYTGLLLLLPVAGVVLAQAWRARARVTTLAADVLLVGSAVAAGFFLVSPMFLAHPERLLEGIRHQGEYSASGHDGILISPWSEWWTYYIRTGLIPGMTWPVVVAAAVGLVLLWRRQAGWIVLLTAATIYGTLEYSVAKPAPFSARYLLPMVPLLAVAAGVALGAVEAALRRRASGAVALVCCVAVFVAPPLVMSWLVADEARHDTRTAAGRWMDEHIPAGARIVLTEGLLNLPATDGWYARWQVDNRGKSPGLATEWGEGPPPYFVVSSFTTDRFLEHPDAVPERTAFYRAVLEDFEVVAQFRPRWFTYGKHSPVITVARPGGGHWPDTTDGPAPSRPMLPFGQLESPQDAMMVSDSVPIRGWAIGEGGLARIEATIDGSPWRTVPVNTARSDVTRAHWAASRGWDRHGWELVAPLPVDLAAGRHALAFRAIDRAGNAAVVGTVQVVVEPGAETP